ncbi:DNA-binding transcriptional regulator, LysR family [Arthrobacter sp. yr096]|nr:DNA-binding transcriptional regulator, LysR family [Arthrobacter sp. yr096]
MRQFVSLFETESTRDTAVEMGADQSTISRSLGRLEEELGVALFHRQGRRLKVNRFGVLFQRHAIRAIRELEAGQHRLKVLSDPDSGLIRLGFLQSVGLSLLPAVIRLHHGISPDARFELIQAEAARDLYAWLEDDIIDCAVVTPPPAARQSEWLQLRSQQLCLVFPLGHRLATAATPELSDLADEPFIAFASGTDLRPVVDAMLSASGIAPHIAFETSEIETLRGLIAAGLGVGIMPLPEEGTNEHLTYRPLVPEQRRKLGLAWSVQSLHVPAVEAFIRGVTLHGEQI